MHLLRCGCQLYLDWNGIRIEMGMEISLEINGNEKGNCLMGVEGIGTQIAIPHMLTAGFSQPTSQVKQTVRRKQT